MRKLTTIPKGAAILVLIAGFIGFADATYLSVLHFTNQIPNCFVLGGCELVTTSKYAVIAGVPMALLGAIYYLAVFVLSVAYLDSRKIVLMKIIGGFSVLSFLMSVTLVYLQLFVIHSICPYCMLSALTSTTIFVTMLTVYWRSPKIIPDEKP